MKVEEVLSQGVPPTSPPAPPAWWNITKPTKSSPRSFFKGPPLAHHHHHLPSNFRFEVSIHSTVEHSWVGYSNLLFPVLYSEPLEKRAHISLTLNLNDQHRQGLKIFQLSEIVKLLKAQWKVSRSSHAILSLLILFPQNCLHISVIHCFILVMCICPIFSTRRNTVNC